MQAFVAYDGKRYPVRDGFLIYPEGWTQAEEARVRLKFEYSDSALRFLCAPRDYAITPQELAEQFKMVTQPFTEAERDYIKAWDNRNNMNAALLYLQGRDYRDFGFTTLCQVHGNLHTRSYTCGCSFHILFDHHLEHPQNEDIRVLRADHICEQHARANDLESAFWWSARDSAKAA